MTIQSKFRTVGIQGDLSPVKLRYLAVAYAPIQVTAPSRNVYEVYGGVEFQVAEQDMAWFLARRDERGRVLYQVVAVPVPAPVVEIQPIIASFSIIEEQLELEDESEVPVKKSRKNKAQE